MFTEDVLSKKICDLGLLNTVSTLFNESNHPPPPPYLGLGQSHTLFRTNSETIIYVVNCDFLLKVVPARKLQSFTVVGKGNSKNSSVLTHLETFGNGMNALISKSGIHHQLCLQQIQ